MTTTEDVRKDLREYIDENFLYMHPDVALSDDEDMLARGVIDSLGFVEIVESIQTRYGIEVLDVEITEENFGSINRIAAFVSAKRGAS